MDLPYSNFAGNTSNIRENCVIQNKQNDSNGHSQALVQKKIKIGPSKSEPITSLYKQPENLVHRAFVKIPAVNSLDFKHLENSLFFQLLFERYSHLFNNTEPLLELKMPKSNYLYPTKALNNSERNENFTCSKTVRDGMNERRALKLFRLHKARASICRCKSASNVGGRNKNVPLDGGEMAGNNTTVPTKHRGIRMSKTVKNVAKSVNIAGGMITCNENIEKNGKLNFHKVNENLPEADYIKKDKKSCTKSLEDHIKYLNSKTFEEQGKKQKLRKFNGFIKEDSKSTDEERENFSLKTLGKMKKQDTNNKNRPGNDAAEIKAKTNRKVRAAWRDNMSGDTSTDSNAPQQNVLKNSGHRLEKTKNSRDIPYEIAITTPNRRIPSKSDKKGEMPNKNRVSFNIPDKPDSDHRVKSALKKNKGKAGSYTDVSARAGLMDMTQHELKMPISNCIPNKYITESMNSAKKENSVLSVMETPVTPTKSHLRSPRVLTNMVPQMDTTPSSERYLKTPPSMNTVLKTMENPKKLLPVELKTDVQRLETARTCHLNDTIKNIEELCIAINTNYSEQTKSKPSEEGILRSIARTTELLQMENIESLDAASSPTTNVISSLEEFHDNCVEPTLKSTTESLETRTSLTAETPTKACIKYNKTAQQALSVLNNGVSNALRESLCSIDEIKFRVRNTIEEIHASDKLYQRLKAQHGLASQSSPLLTEPDEAAKEEPNCSDLMRALGLGLVQIQSENQFRLALLSNADESIPELTGYMDENDESPLKIPPLADSTVDLILPQQSSPILPKIVPIVEDTDRPCTTLRQQKIDIFNIPPHIPLQDGDCPGFGQTTRKMRLASSKDNVLYPIRRPQICTLKRPSTPFSKVLSKKFMKRELAPEIKLQLQEIVARLGLDNLPRSRAHPDLYNKLIKEFVATDSLVEFQRQMSHANQLKGGKGQFKPEKDTGVPKMLTETKFVKNNKVVQIMAEELYVPDRKINKIAPTNLNSTLKNRNVPRLRAKCCQFLYRERKKKRCNRHMMKVKKDLRQDSSNTIELSRKASSKSRHSDKEKQSKYANSLWFSCHSKKEIKHCTDKSSKQPVPITKSDTVIQCDSKKSVPAIENAAQTQTDDNANSRTYWPQLNLQPQNCKSGLDCFDILDEITLKDIKPLESEYPRRDHMGLAPFYTPTENTYLYKLVYGSTEEQFLQLISTQEPSVHCSTSNCQLCNTAQKATEATCIGKASEEFLDKNKKGDWYTGKENIKPENKRKKLKKVVENCFPLYNIRTVAGSSHSTVTTCRGSESIRSTLMNNKKLRKNQKKNAAVNSKNRGPADPSHKQQPHVESANIDKKSQIKPKRKMPKNNNADVAAKLLPYMFDPKMRYPTTITAMPVTITTYTNPKCFQRNKVSAKEQGGDFAASTQTKLERKDKTEPKLHLRTSKTAPKSLPTNDKKIWGTKYNKSPGGNLISYLEKQNSDSPRKTFEDAGNDEFFPKPKNTSGPTASKMGKKIASTAPSAGAPTQQPHTGKAKTIDKPSMKATSTRALQHKQETNKKPAQPFTIETDIQNVIEMIEGKIIDLVSSPEKQHSETFTSVEKEIVDILKAMQTDPVKPLQAINETAEKIKESDCGQKKKKTPLQSKTSNNLQKPLEPSDGLSVKTDTQLIDSHVADDKSHDEESFEITSACAPKLTPRMKLNQQVSVEQDNLPVLLKTDGEGSTTESLTLMHCYVPQAEKPYSQSKTKLRSSKNEIETLKNEIKMQDVSESNNLVAQLEKSQTSIPIIIKQSSGLLNIDNNFGNREDYSEVEENRCKSELQNIASKSKKIYYNKISATSLPEVLNQRTQEHDLVGNKREESESDVTNSDNQIQIIKSISNVEASDSDKNSEENSQQDSKVASKTNAVVEVRSDQFLTPFMYALTQYRKEERHASSYNILEFLDTLTNISEESGNFASKTITGCRMSAIHYKHKIQVVYPLHTADILYPVVIWEPVTVSTNPNKGVKILFRPEMVTHELQRARNLFLSLNLGRFVGFGAPSPFNYEINPKNTDLLSYDRNQVDPCARSPLNALCDSIGKHASSNRAYDEDHGAFLNGVYGMLFTVVFLSLSFNYSCQ